MAKGSIYTFTVDKKEKKEVEVKRKNKQTGEEEKVIQTKTVNTPVKFYVKKPTRRIADEGETYYASQLSKNVKKGIVTKAMLAKQYIDTGGTFTEAEGKSILVLMKEVDDLKSKYQLLKSTDGSEKEAEELEKEIIKKQKLLIEIENSTQAVYQHTADARAERATLLWYTVQLAFQEGEDGDGLPYFDGAIYEERLENLYDKEEKEEDEFDYIVTNKFMKAISYWFYSQSVKQDEIDKFVNMNNER
jgi:hypothetical protein